MPPRLIIPALLLSFVLNGIAVASDTSDCRELYSRIDYRQNFSIVSRFLKPSTIQEARMVVQAREKVKVKDIFPGTIEIKTGFDTTKTVPFTDLKVFKKYHEEFDTLMEARVRAGLFPRQELTAWKAWLKKNQEKNKYPSIVDEEIIKFMQGDGTMAEFFDIQFANYIYSAKKVPVANIPSYLKAHYPDTYSRLKAYAGRNGKRLFAVAATIGTPVVAYMGAGAATEILTAFVAPIIDPTKKLAKDTVKGVTEKGVEAVSKALVSGPDKYQEKLVALRETQTKLSAEDFSKVKSRVDLKDKVDAYDAAYLKYLPEFHEVVLSLEKTFDDKWTAALKEKLPTLPTLRATYDTQSSTLDTLTGFIDSRGTPATPDELEKLARWSGKLMATEDEISDDLADWAFYRLNVGKDKIDPVVDREYQRLYTDYLASMNAEKLRKKVVLRMESVVAKLEGWADKNKATKETEKPLPAPGKTPDITPPAPDFTP